MLTKIQNRQPRLNRNNLVYTNLGLEGSLGNEQNKVIEHKDKEEGAYLNHKEVMDLGQNGHASLQLKNSKCIEAHGLGKDDLQARSIIYPLESKSVN